MITFRIYTFYPLYSSMASSRCHSLTYIVMHHSLVSSRHENSLNISSLTGSVICIARTRCVTFPKQTALGYVLHNQWMALSEELFSSSEKLFHITIFHGWEFITSRSVGSFTDLISNCCVCPKPRHGYPTPHDIILLHGLNWVGFQFLFFVFCFLFFIC